MEGHAELFEPTNNPANSQAAAGGGANSTSPGSSQAGGDSSDQATGGSQETPRLVTITLPGSTDEVKRGRGRPRKDGTAPIPAPAPAQAKSRAVAAQADPQLEANIAAFIKTAFDITSLKAGPVWAMTNEEAATIAAPAARILERAGLGAVGGKYSDYVILLLAVTGVIVPRIIASKTVPFPENKNRSVIPNAGPKLQPVPGGAKGQTTNPSKQPDRESPAYGEDSILQSSPALA